jgi:beta-lactamase family protein
MPGFTLQLRGVPQPLTVSQSPVYIVNLVSKLLELKYRTFSIVWRIALLASVLLPCTAFSQQSSAGARVYFPAAGNWQQKTPASLGLRQGAIDSAIAFAILNESRNPRVLSDDQAATFGKEPFGNIIGPMPDRGEPTGLIIYKGYIVASWGEPLRCDMTHSVTKSFLSTVVGLAVDRGLIHNVNDSAAAYVPPIEIYEPVQSRSGPAPMIHLFAGLHNRSITWNHLLRQTSDWEGSLWGKPEWADRPDSSAADWKTRARKPAGSSWEYNDVRVNVLALAATSVWRRPLPQVLKDEIMDPIGASDTWRWTGYRNAWIVLDGVAVQSVSGGGHWGGGMIINAFDMARFGLLTLHKGKWNGRQLISSKWVKQALTPTPVRPGYGYMNWYLNHDKKMLPSAPADAFLHLGNGANIIYVDPANEIVMVTRWLNSRRIDGVVLRLLQALH